MVLGASFTSWPNGSIDWVATGFCASANFPTTAGSFQPGFAGGSWDGFVAKDYAELAGANNNVDPRLSNPFDISYDEPSWDKYRMSRVTAEINWTINGVVDLRSLTGYQHDVQANLWDNDFTYQPLSWASANITTASPPENSAVAM